MTNTAEHTAIQIAYEEEGLSLDQIADDRDLEILTVKSCLMQCSSKYRKDYGQEEEKDDGLNFNNDELKMANQVFVRLLHSDNEYLALKAATYVRDDKKGRKEVVKAVANTNTNIFLLNEKLAQVKRVAASLVNGGATNRQLKEAINV